MAGGQAGRVNVPSQGAAGPQTGLSATLAARASVPLAFKPSELPINAHREAILEALQNHQLILVAGDTGSGKSTQLPQYCLQQGRGLSGLIAHTQPRRLAARALATRIAEETGLPLGRGVGFKVRFADQVSAETRLALMTDGLLLAELASDPDLKRYDTIIVDEAHERSLNVDLLLGVLKRLLPRRSDLKVIITSATLDVERIARFFDDAPVIRVSGRGFPIEVRFNPGTDDGEDPDLPQAVLHAYEEIAAEPSEIARGDILVFLPGEREIRDVGEFLERELKQRVEIMPLYSRLSWEQQSKIFQRGMRQRIVLATNVAETSVTVPGIRSVIDSGLARISRYSLRTRLQRLPIEAVSQASAEQRKGRCGRIGSGLCLRLYSQDDFETRVNFTEPEILRTNLAALLLRLAADGLGQAEDFPFVDPPDSRSLNDGYRLLQELEALDADRIITRRGRAMARLPLDPRLARAFLESKRFHAESELLAIVSALSVPDVRLSDGGGARGQAPRENTEESAAAAFEDSRSEFLSMVKLWRAYRLVRQGTRRELRQWCKDRRFSLLRLSEWEDVHSQVAERGRELGITAHGWNGSYAGVHRALLAGFCTLVGSRSEEGTYIGTRGVQFHLLPGTTLARRKPRWVMAANIVETSRVFARRVAQIEPKWLEGAAAHLLKHEYLAPDWDEHREQVTAQERISFLGLIVSANRQVNYGPIAPEDSRRIFAREALVYGRLKRRPAWVAKNDEVIAAAQRMEERLRTRDLILGAEQLVEFYDKRLPRQVSSAATLEHFSRHLTPDALRALSMSNADVLARAPDVEALQRFPERTAIATLDIPIDYRFAPGESADGATLALPLLALPQLTQAVLQSAVPGFAAPRIEALLRSLPKEARRNLIPINQTALQFLGAAGDQTDISGLQVWLKEQRGLPDQLLKFDASVIPQHLKPQLVVKLQGRELARGEHLPALRRQCAQAATQEAQRLAVLLYSAASWKRFESEELTERVQISTEQGEVTLYPALKVHEGALSMALEWSAEEAEIRWRDASVRLARLLLAAQVKELSRHISAKSQFLLSASAYFSSEEIIDTLLQLAVRSACFAEAPAPRQRLAFEAAVDGSRANLFAALEQAMATMSGWLAEAAGIRRELDDARVRSLKPAAEETRRHLQALLSAGAIQAAPLSWLRHWPRYLKAELRRWQRNASRGQEQPGIHSNIAAWSERVEQLRHAVHAEGRESAAFLELSLWLEEYRVSLYAQELKTLGPISAARMEGRAAEIESWLNR